MNARFWFTIVLLSGVFAGPQSVRAQEESKADRLRAEAKKLLAAAEELDRGAKADKAEREEKKIKADKKPGEKKKEKEDNDDDKRPAKPEPRKADQGPARDKEPQARDPKPSPKGPPLPREGADRKEPPQGGIRLELMLRGGEDGPGGGHDGKGPVPMKAMLFKGQGDGAKGGPAMMGMPGKSPGGPEQKLMHMTQAAQHLREAGVNDMAEQIERAAGEMKRQLAQQRDGGGSGELRQVIEQLRHEVGELREVVKRMQQEGTRR